MRRQRMWMINQIQLLIRMRSKLGCLHQICLNSETTKKKEKSLWKAYLNFQKFQLTNNSRVSLQRHLLDSPLSPKPQPIKTWKQRPRSNFKCSNSFSDKWKLSRRSLLISQMIQTLKLSLLQCRHTMPSKSVQFSLTNFVKFKHFTTVST